MLCRLTGNVPENLPHSTWAYRAPQMAATRITREGCQSASSSYETPRGLCHVGFLLTTSYLLYIIMSNLPYWKLHLPKHSTPPLLCLPELRPKSPQRPVCMGTRKSTLSGHCGCPAQSPGALPFQVGLPALITLSQGSSPVEPSLTPREWPVRSARNSTPLPASASLSWRQAG